MRFRCNNHGVRTGVSWCGSRTSRGNQCHDEEQPPNADTATDTANSANAGKQPSTAKTATHAGATATTSHPATPTPGTSDTTTTTAPSTADPNAAQATEATRHDGRSAERHARRSQTNLEPMTSRSHEIGEPSSFLGAGAGRPLNSEIFMRGPIGGGLRMTTCEACGASFERRPGRGRPARFCSVECRKAFVGPRNAYTKPLTARASRVHRDPLTCAWCGAVMRRAAKSLPQGEARCSRCRPQNPRWPWPDGPRPCEECLVVFAPKVNKARYCPACVRIRAGAWVTARAAARRALGYLPARPRRAREYATPGLTHHQRSALLAVWKRQGRRCMYCDRLASTVDHVVPLLLGGTNYEGNLVPACLSCNSSKGCHLLIVWRARRRVRLVA